MPADHCRLVSLLMPEQSNERPPNEIRLLALGQSTLAC